MDGLGPMPLPHARGNYSKCGRTPQTHRVLELPGLQKHKQWRKTLVGKCTAPTHPATIKSSIPRCRSFPGMQTATWWQPGMAKLTANRQWAAGDSFGLGDIAVGTALGYLSIRFAELNWQASYPDLVRLSERLETRPSFKNSVPCAQTITDKVM